MMAEVILVLAEAIRRARKQQRSIGLRVTPDGIWYAAATTESRRERDIEIATVHCDGRVEWTRWDLRSSCQCPP
jgi:hypothetical protein